MADETAPQDSAPENTETEGLESLPESWQKTFKSLRAENAKYRTKVNEVESKYIEAGELLKAANNKLDSYSKLEDDHARTLAELSEAQTVHGRLKAAVDAGIPSWADRLQGSSPEEWEADAKKLAEQIGAQKPPTGFNDTSQGKGSVPALNSDELTRGFARALGVI